MICPGAIQEHFHSEARIKEIAQQIPLARLGQPQEVAALVTWLAKDSPDYITGSMIPISGGWDY